MNDRTPLLASQAFVARTNPPSRHAEIVEQDEEAWSILMAGTMGTFELRVASYRYMFASCTGTMVAIGGATALDTLCRQAITSTTHAKNRHLLGLYLQRSVCLLFVPVISPLWWFHDRLFVVLGQSEDFATATGSSLKILILGGLLQVITECLKKYLQVQDQRNAVIYAITVSTAIGIFANFAFFRLAKTGIWAAPVAVTIYHFSSTTLLVALICFSKTTRKT
ncbi:MAG: hypothetical protein M1818_005519 [Claussenomyces sp. TS43310]|nr:MAG: hypothetical protein M1818_005519 [Claussenomyces sp. TS43310]